MVGNRAAAVFENSSGSLGSPRLSFPSLISCFQGQAGSPQRGRRLEDDAAGPSLVVGSTEPPQVFTAPPKRALTALPPSFNTASIPNINGFGPFRPAHTIHSYSASGR